MAQEVWTPMHGGTYPGRALPTQRGPAIAALVALLVGGAIATGIWWLTDNDVDLLPEPATKVIVTQPVEPGAGTAAKDEGAVAAAVGGAYLSAVPQRSTGYPAPDRTAADAPTSQGITRAAARAKAGSAYGTSQYRVDPSTGFATAPPVKDYSRNGATGDYAHGPLPPAQTGTRSDGDAGGGSSLPPSQYESRGGDPSRPN
jgi:hypothetical protein